jgi:hypothetical protein
MAFTRADMLATAERWPAAAGARDRKAWVGLFMSNGRVEDPVGSTPHRGIAAIGRFYDTFVGPRDIRFHPDVDIVVGPTVVRDGELEVTMASTVTLRVPVVIRYDLQDDAGELKIAALSAFWELPAMVGQFLRVGIRAVPARPSVVTAAADQPGRRSALWDSSADSAASAPDPKASSRASWMRHAPATRSACGDDSSAGYTSPAVPTSN